MDVLPCLTEFGRARLNGMIIRMELRPQIGPLGSRLSKSLKSLKVTQFDPVSVAYPW